MCDLHETYRPWPRRVTIGLWGVVALIGALALISCVPAHFDDNPKPANDAVWIPAGAALDVAQQAAGLKWYVRVPVDGAAASLARFPQWHGKHIIDSGFDILFGAAVAEIGGGIVRGLKGKKHHRCQYAGADGKVHDGWCVDQ